MVGGWVIARDSHSRMPGVHRYWCVDRNGDECAVYGKDPDDGIMPGLEDQIWWQSGKIYFDGDKRSLIKVGNSFDPRNDH